ncbi:hypothetical protein NC652_003475 [Populus alba x Populus x berolinensis]|nr:hypothetical protein NC652_003475 [Populus alba x Populus x berolinensis]
MKKWRKSWNKGWVARNVVTCSILMVINVKQGQAKMILDVLEEMRMKGFSHLLAASQCSALLTYREKEGGNGALKFFVELKEKHLKREIGKDADEDWKRNM